VNDAAADDRWVTGDHFGLPIPADPAALCDGGTAFLTRAFRVSGALSADNAVTRIGRFEEVPGGSTGRKLLLRIEYEKPDVRTHTDLFVKFSRDLDNTIRDRGKTQMESEVSSRRCPARPGSRSPYPPLSSPTTTRSLSRNDPNIKDDESVRAPLQMLSNALNLWETAKFGDLLDGALS